METGETPSLGPSHCFAHLFLSFALCLANLYEVPLAKYCKMWRWWQRFTGLVCLSSIISLSFTFVTFSSLSKPLFPRLIGPSILTVCTRDVRMKHSQNSNSLSIVFYHSPSPYTQHTKPWHTWMASQSYFIVLTVHTCNVPNHDRLSPVWGSLRLTPTIINITQPYNIPYIDLLQTHNPNCVSYKAYYFINKTTLIT